ncbi:hypothetical protein T492DRAFT_513209 [Pavlovales sp. CCMP2436]|nr:hypothetical protein T492DRAFT_513209 [Pavlovales sp. CCMP2436]
MWLGGIGTSLAASGFAPLPPPAPNNNGCTDKRRSRPSPATAAHPPACAAAGCGCFDRGPHETCVTCGSSRAVSRSPLPISRPDEGERTGMRAAWRWLARLLNLPVRRVTVVLLGPFLDALGAKLLAAYGRQFGKLLEHVALVFMPKVRATEGLQDEERGSLSRLETIVSGLRETLRAGCAPETHEALLMPLFKEEDDTRDEGADGDW